MDGVNLFQYGGNQPSTVADPSGWYRARVQVDAFIPKRRIALIPGIVYLKGDNRTFANTPPGPAKSRQTTVVWVEMEKCVKDDPLIAKTTILSPSTRIIDNGGPFAISQTLIGTYWHRIKATRIGDCIVRIDIRTHGTIPWTLAPSAPAIDWDVSFLLRVHEDLLGDVHLTGDFSGKHDGYPAYEAFVQDTRVYKASPQLTIFSLYPPMEKNAYAEIDILDEKRRVTCCECKARVRPRQ